MIAFQICSHMRFLRCFKIRLQYINQRLRVLRVFFLVMVISKSLSAGSEVVALSWLHWNHCLRVLRVAPVLTTSMSESPSAWPYVSMRLVFVFEHWDLYAWHDGFLNVAKCLECCCCVIRDTCVYALTRQAQQQQQYRSHIRRGWIGETQVMMVMWNVLIAE